MHSKSKENKSTDKSSEGKKVAAVEKDVEKKGQQAAAEPASAAEKTEESVTDEQASAIKEPIPSPSGSAEGKSDRDNELDLALSKIAELEDELLRLKASQANQIKRLQGDVERAKMQGVEQVAAGLIDVADNLERALAHETDDLVSLRKGVEMMLDQLQKLVIANGIEKIQPEQGEKFDPKLHLATKQEQSAELEANRITNVLACGYHQNGRILRPAQVVVSAAALDTEK